MKGTRIVIALLFLTAASQACNYPTAVTAMPTATSITTTTATTAPSPYPTYEPMRLVDAKDGDTLTASIDPRSGLPTIPIQVEVRVSGRPLLALDADGLQVAVSGVDDPPPAQPITLTWTPWHGNGPYRLGLWLVKGAGEIISQITVSVYVSGIPDGTPTIEERFVQLYKEFFDLDLTAPAFARSVTNVESAAEEWNRWISAAYIEDQLYAIQIFDNGEIVPTKNNLSVPVQPVGTCRPLGKYKMLVLIVDYGNTGIGPEGVASELDEAAAAANQRWAEYAASIGLLEPILEIETTTAYIESPPNPGEFLTPEQAKTLTGHDPTQFNLLAEIDLDAENRAVLNHSNAAGGFAFLGWCHPSHPQGVNLGFGVDGRRSLELAGFSLYEHELMHLMGWMHWWPDSDGSSLAQFSAGRHLPSLLYGWTDTDGDGTIEIYDPTPYGLQP